MKLLFDQNLSFRLVLELLDIFPGCEQVARLGLANADDATIWQHARTSGYTIVSQDSDFAEMVLLRRPPPKVIWLRCGNCSTGFIANLLRHHRGSIEHFSRDQELGCLEIYQ